ncbi:MAG: FAD-dependent oxidoreductase [Polyangiales bacterium]
MHTQRVAIIGAGLTGMSAAYALAKAGVTVHVYEAAAHVGGLTRSFRLWDETVDLGPHIFAGYDPAALSLWMEVIGPEFRMLPRDTRIAIAGRVYRYPLAPGALLCGLGALGTLRAGLGYVRAQLTPAGPVDSARYFFTRRFGTYLYGLFFRPYCQKLWGLDPAEVDASFAAALVGDISIGRALLNRLKGRVGAREASLQTSFPYALRGAGAFCERAAKLVAQRGGQVKLGAPVSRLVTSGDRVTGVMVGDTQHNYDWTISTMPLTALVPKLGEVSPPVERARTRLRFRSAVLVYLRVRGRSVLPCLWMYVNDGSAAGRITNFARWQGRDDADRQTIAVEYWCARGDDTYGADDPTIIARATWDLRRAVEQVDLIVEDGFVVRVPTAHPVLYRGYHADVALLSRQVARYDGLSVVGRGGGYVYDAQASALQEGLATARRVADVVRAQRAHAPAAELLDAGE